MEAITLLLFAVLFIVGAFMILTRNSRRARLVNLIDRLPGPPSYPIVGSLLPFILAPRRDVMRLRLEETEMYKPLFRTWVGFKPELNLMKPEFIEVVLSSTKHLQKAYTYTMLEPWLGTGLLTSTGAKWHRHRKMITPTFHFKILDNFVEVFSEKSKILVDKLQKEVGSPGFDVYPYITKCALDIICETAMGTTVDAQEDRDSDYVTAVYDISELSLHRMFRPWLYPDITFRMTKEGKRHDKCLQVLHNFTNKVIKERKQLHKNTTQDSSSSVEDELLGKKKRLAFLDLLLESSLDGVKLTDEELREEVDTFMFEGHDTTSAGICWTIYLLGLHNEVQDRVFEELDNIFQDSDRSATTKDLQEMKYLERVIKETLRLYPSVPFISRDLTEDIEIDGYTIPAGTMATVLIYNVHRDPEYYPDPEKFDPDRFLPERVAKRHPYAYIPFSAGPRNCIGQKFALLEEKSVLSYILRRYRLTSLEKVEEVTLMSELILRPEKGIPVVIEPRKVL